MHVVYGISVRLYMREVHIKIKDSWVMREPSRSENVHGEKGRACINTKPRKLLCETEEACCCEGMWELM